MCRAESIEARADDYATSAVAVGSNPSGIREKLNNGVWHSLVVRLVRDQEAASSNLVTPTISSVHN